MAMDWPTERELRAGFQSTWAFIYYRVAAYFLEKPEQSTLEEIDLAH